MPERPQSKEWYGLQVLAVDAVAITTMGIGDLTPNTDLGRSLTAAEALFGQIYLVTVVAVIVANLKPKRTNG